jgi:hypothetical protein
LLFEPGYSPENCRTIAEHLVYNEQRARAGELHQVAKELLAALNKGNRSGIPGISMLSQYSTRVKVRVGLGLLALVAARVLISFFHDVLTTLAWTCMDVGAALCIWGAISHAMDKGYRLPTWLRWLLIVPVGVGVYIGVLVLAISVDSLLADLVATRLTPRLPDWPPVLIVSLIMTSIAGSYCFVLLGATTAPKHRVVTAIVLAVSCLCATAYLLVGLRFALTFGMLGGIWTSELMWIYVPWAGAFVAVLVACVQVWCRESRMRTTQLELSART